MKPHPTASRADRIDGLVLVVILLIVAGFAGAASFTHVKEWTLDNSPPGTGEWFGWANAVISELIPTAALLTIRRRKRTDGPIGYPMFLLVAAVALSLAAQLAVAKPGLSGWLLSAVPALAFIGLSKLVLTTGPVPAPGEERAATRPAEQPAAVPPTEPPAPARAPVEATPVALVPVEPTRPGPLAPVSSAAFTRRNGTPLAREVTR
ncbi:DUF2637 domain-containing protein [Micromonospora globispora]|uniref:DUF2637 domain-containing protein n=1 Tax=Micromonospora globispora TaxID=1450148 RepID=A0A317KJG0_9ACTN|nr:DUF2637 domain-containing protein [Micromonospora globispora]PWU52010.1 DUF2637 domain-containing protein [Micromonospora globispora]PWU53125.1 DUF2637 domain-containing protein [Micromonospora globispora]